MCRERNKKEFSLVYRCICFRPTEGETLYEIMHGTTTYFVLFLQTKENYRRFSSYDMIRADLSGDLFRSGAH